MFGDSFLQYYHNTWCESLVEGMGWESINHSGFPGGSQHTIYEAFVEFAKHKDTDIVLFCHTEPMRLPNKSKLGITPSSVWKDDPNGIIFPWKDDPKNVDVINAARNYYSYICYERFHTDTFNLMIKEIQNICYDKRWKQIHLQSFPKNAPKIHGFWLDTDLFNIGDKVLPHGWMWDKNLKNHFSTELHTKLTKWLIPHISWYLDKDIDHHIVRLYPEELA